MDSKIKSLLLPEVIFRKSQVGELLREVVEVRLNFEQALILDHNLKFEKHLMSTQLKSLAEKNEIKISDLKDLKEYEIRVKNTFNNLKTIHFSFSQPASSEFLHKLINWLRREINPDLVLSVGLDPSIGIGSRIRTTNKYFDFSFAQKLVHKRGILLNKIRENET